MTDTVKVSGWLSGATFDGTTVTVTHSGGRATTIPLANVQAVGVEQPGFMGVLRITAAGNTRREGRGYAAARRDPLAVTFLPWHRKQFNAFRDEIAIAMRDLV